MKLEASDEDAAMCRVYIRCFFIPKKVQRRKIRTVTKDKKGNVLTVGIAGSLDAKNGGELSLQLLAAEGYDNISPENMDMARRLANLAPIMASYIGSYTMDIYMTTLAMDKKSDQKYDENGVLTLVIADVSGKGVTAALFMALSKQMIQSRMMMNNGLTSDALSVTNVRLLEESIPDMFVTVWLGTITLSTGHLVFVDAGHEYPAIQKGGGMFVIEKDNHSMAMAALKKAKFKTNEDYLKPGDTIYLYTDGVTEAHNEAGEMFGMERLAKALNEVVGLSPEEIDDHVRKRIAEFVGGAEQFDDITTLCFRYLGPTSGSEKEDNT